MRERGAHNKMEHGGIKDDEETKGPDMEQQGTLPEEGKGEGGDEVEGAVNFSRQLPKPPPLGVGQVSEDGKALIVAGDEAIAMSVLEDLRLGQRAQDDMARATRKRCTYAGCEKPDNSRCFYNVDEGKTAGGQDWSSLVGHVLCHACYQRFNRSGTLERSTRRPISKAVRRCTFHGTCFSLSPHPVSWRSQNTKKSSPGPNHPGPKSRKSSGTYSEEPWHKAMTIPRQQNLQFTATRRP